MEANPHSQSIQVNLYSQSIKVNLSADVDERRRGYARHDVIVVSGSEVLFLQSGAVIQLGIEVLCGRLVEYSSTAERRWTMVDGKYTSRGNGVNAT